MSNEQEWRLLTRLLEQGAQLPNLLAYSAGTRAEVAPARAGAVVRTDAREWRDQRLNQAPIDRKVAGSSFENDRGPRGIRLAEAVEMQPPPAEVDQPPGRGKRWRGRILRTSRDGDHHPNEKRQAHGPL